MKVYLQEQVVYANKEDAMSIALGLPSFALCQINEVNVGSVTLYQLLVYCFDDDVDAGYLRDYLLDVPSVKE